MWKYLGRNISVEFDPSSVCHVENSQFFSSIYYNKVHYYAIFILFLYLIVKKR